MGSIRETWGPNDGSFPVKIDYRGWGWLARNPPNREIHWIVCGSTGIYSKDPSYTLSRENYMAMFGSNKVAGWEIYSFYLVLYVIDEHAKFIKNNRVEQMRTNTLQLKADATSDCTLPLTDPAMIVMDCHFVRCRVQVENLLNIEPIVDLLKTRKYTGIIVAHSCCNPRNQQRGWASR